MRLRPATLDDAQRLLDWRNDSDTRAASASTGPVASEEHRTWLEKSLSRPDRRLLIAEDDDGPVGTLRLDEAPNAVEISITLAPQARGRGYAAPLLRLATAAGGLYVARIRPGNAASRRAFEAAGFFFTHLSDDMEWFRLNSEDGP